MAMINRWLTAFKDIHGRTPTKEDYRLAPKHIKDELLGEKEQIHDEPPVTQLVKKNSVRLKRPADDQCSPFKPLPKRHALNTVMSPTINQKNPRILFMNEINQRTPIKSPQKSCRRSQQIVNVGALLAPTPEKRIPENEENNEPHFEPEEIPETSEAKKSKKKITGKNIAKVFDPITGRIQCRAFNPSEAEEVKKEKKKITNKSKENFVRINLRKKSFTRGKVSAETKRKLRKKQMYKKRFGGNR